ncbi:MAG TPA: formate dehydrogenase subunit gamma [Thermoanaerobaculia bacterium]|nr:formate dehydrogenase subunit gamma [Thermoanaerobaculia bacterium]
MSDSHLLANGRIERYSFNERIWHWISAVSYVYLLLTGLAFWTPWLFWIAVILGGATISRELHPWAGVIFFISVLWMYAKWGAQMRSTDSDRAWWRAVGHYTRNEDEAMPPVERFNGGQKMLFWAFVWCGLALLLSGLVLWFPHWIPWSLRALRFVAVLVHAVAALLTIGLFMIHVYMGLAVERGAFGSMTRGEVSRAWARKHHRLWHDEVVRGSAAEK